MLMPREVRILPGMFIPKTKASRPPWPIPEKRRSLETGLAEALGLPVLPGPAPRIVAFVGAGGKTCALFAAADSAGSLRTIVTTTTHIRDPRLEPGRRIGPVFTDIRFSEPPHPGMDPMADLPSPVPGGPPPVLAARTVSEEGKLAGIHPLWVPRLALGCDLLLLEADGSRGLPVKAPGQNEPVVPPDTDTLVGVIGLDCLGRPLLAGNAHRPELLSLRTGCGIGEPFGPGHLVALIRNPEGLFKGCPAGCRRILLLNKEDAADPGLLEDLLERIRSSEGLADRVLLGSLTRGRVRSIPDSKRP